MKKILAAVALAIALPAVAHAQSAPAAAPKPMKHCCCKDKSKPMDCCEEHGRGQAGHDDHAGHDMSQPQQHQQ